MTGINFFTMIGSAVFLQGLGSLMQYLYPETSRSPEAFMVAFSLCAICPGGGFIVSLSYLHRIPKESPDKLEFYSPIDEGSGAGPIIRCLFLIKDTEKNREDVRFISCPITSLHRQSRPQCLGLRIRHHFCQKPPYGFLFFRRALLWPKIPNLSFPVQQDFLG